MAEAIKGVAYTTGFSLYTTAGALIVNPGVLTAKISKDFGDYADITAITEEDTTYGQLKVALTATEMNADTVMLYVKDDTAGCIPFTCTISPKSEAVATAAALATVDGIVDDILVDTGTTLDALIKDLPTNAELATALTGADDAVLAQIALVKLKTDTIGALAVTVTSPVAADGTIDIEQGDSYPASRSRSITVAVADATHALLLDDADCTAYLRGTQFTWEAVSVTETVAGYDVVFEPTVAETAALTARQSYKLIACYDNADPADDDATTLAHGTLTVTSDIPAVT